MCASHLMYSLSDELINNQAALTFTHTRRWELNLLLDNSLHSIFFFVIGSSSEKKMQAADCRKNFPVGAKCPVLLHFLIISTRLSRDYTAADIPPFSCVVFD